MNNRERRFFNIAKEISKFSNFKPHVGAVITQGKRIISTGFNSNKTHPLQHKYNIYRNFNDYASSVPLEHAEVHALSHLIGKKLPWDTFSIFVYREFKDGTPACSKPCEACDKLIKELGIKNIYYVDKNGNYVKERVL